MPNKYRVLAVESRDRISHDDFIRPRNSVTLAKVENGETVTVLLPIRWNWKRGEVVELDEHDVRRALLTC
jgi:hypothetical protein